jgi:hypothetical protein
VFPFKNPTLFSFSPLITESKHVENVYITEDQSDLENLKCTVMECFTEPLHELRACG